MKSVWKVEIPKTEFHLASQLITTLDFEYSSTAFQHACILFKQVLQNYIKWYISILLFCFTWLEAKRWQFVISE